ncbi:MAG: 2-oxoacid:acceptor oxidoreductase family protein [Syntrophomonadaceae bacterium]|nr:2-oxoacid:acceptor oxidoreductase family protein [Syntrophomonadaceae bacterium]
MAGRVVKIALAGEGGQGVQSVGEILAEAAYTEGKESIYVPNFGLEQRGGVSIAFVQIADEQIGSPKFKTGDIVVALSGRAVRRMKMHVGPETVFVYEASIDDLEDGDLPQNAARILAVPAIEVSKKDLDPRVFNIIIMGVVIGFTGAISEEQAIQELEHKLGDKFQKNPALRELNLKALKMGIELAQRAQSIA